jgi:hypothetical protein
MFRPRDLAALIAYRAGAGVEDSGHGDKTAFRDGDYSIIYESRGKKSTGACRHRKGVEPDGEKPSGVMCGGFEMNISIALYYGCIFSQSKIFY